MLRRVFKMEHAQSKTAQKPTTSSSRSVTDDFRLNDATVAVHGGERRPGPNGSIVYPIFQSTVYVTSEKEVPADIDYIRMSNTPSQAYLHDKLAALEAAEAAVATASGMSALTGVLGAFLHTGDHLLAARGLYGGTYSYVAEHIERMGLRHDFVDAQEPDTWEAALTPETKVFLVEGISNPLMRVTRLEEVVEFSRSHGLISVIDNTFATPINFKPLSIGFDVCFHSATKYLNGHSDIAAGVVLGSKSKVESVRNTLTQFGGSLDPHAGFLLARGLKTLSLRVRAQNENGQALAEFLEANASVEEVHYPGLKSHPDHERGMKLMSAFGGVLSFRLVGGTAHKADDMMERLRIAYVAASLGGVETLVSRPAVTSHATLSEAQRTEAGISDDLIRVSCGIEDADDLIDDFAQALGA